MKHRYTKNKRKYLYMFLVLLLFSLMIGYAFLTTNLSINGISNVVHSSWDIHFENIVIQPNSVSLLDGDSAAHLTSTTSVSYTVTLSKPGDFYDFTVDVKNDGTIDAMIESVSSKMNGVEIVSLPAYLEYSVTYGRNAPIEAHQLLSAGDKVTYYVHVGYKEDINPSDLPSENVTNIFHFEVVYVQADDSAVEYCHGTVPTPTLTTGLIPVSIADNGVVTAISKNNENWYDYCGKQWANAVLVTETNRSTYQNIADGNGVDTVIPSEEILAYFVWIPRYRYAIPKEPKCSTISGVNYEQHGSCYDPVYVRCGDIQDVEPDSGEYYECYRFGLSDAERDLLVNWLVDIEYYGTYEEALDAYNRYLENDNAAELVEWYNNDNDPDLEIIPIFYPDNMHDTGEVEYNPNNTVNVARPINIVFENSSKPLSTGTGIGTSYYTHPAFSFDNKKLEGLWVGKFQTTGTSSIPTILPNSSALVNLAATDVGQFNVSLKFVGGTFNTNNNNTVTISGSDYYGLPSTADSHMMKNRDWGAAIYLSHSIYGINGQLKKNTGNATGCGGRTNSSCDISFGSASYYPQSTTGNITGIFDMSSSIRESVNVYFAKPSTFMRIPIRYYDSYNSAYINNGPNNLAMCTIGTCGGHALYETASWYDTDDSFFDYSNIHLTRSEGFGFRATTRSANSGLTFRTSLVVY